jgi:hypothetical protein
LSQSLGYHLFDSLKKRGFKTIPAAQIIGKVLNICRKNIHKHLLAHATAHIGFSRQPPYASKQTTSTAARTKRRSWHWWPKLHAEPVENSRTFVLLAYS